jgi:hypothetical protein
MDCRHISSSICLGFISATRAADCSLVDGRCAACEHMPAGAAHCSAAADARRSAALGIVFWPGWQSLRQAARGGCRVMRDSVIMEPSIRTCDHVCRPSSLFAGCPCAFPSRQSSKIVSLSRIQRQSRIERLEPHARRPGTGGRPLWPALSREQMYSSRFLVCGFTSTCAFHRGMCKKLCMYVQLWSSPAPESTSSKAPLPRTGSTPRCCHPHSLSCWHSCT